nr:retrovirus-related Pol polyprotein from transposon TNT 1-94 [Tanacetum cinerariifolium]
YPNKWYQEPRFEKKESYNLGEAITRRTDALCLVRHILRSGGIDEALEDKQPAEMKDDVWKTMQKKASTNVDDAIKDKEKALLMLSSLSKSYKPFVQTMLTGRTTLTFKDLLKALRDNKRMTGSDSSSSSDKLLVADDSGRDLKSLRDSKGKKKVDGGEMNAVDKGGDEFLMKETPMDEILREEKWYVLKYKYHFPRKTG